MPSFVVRVIQDHGAPQEFVGIYIANSIDQLDALVDRHCSIDVCEYAQLPTDNMYVSNHAVPGPERPYEETPEPALSGEEAVGDEWYKLFFGDAQPMWVPLCSRDWASDEERRATIESARTQLHAA